VPRRSPRASKRSGSRLSERFEAREPGETQLLGARRGRRERPQAPGPREELEYQPPVRALQRRSLEVALDLRARVLDQLVVLHARRAGRHARHAAEAAVEVLDHRRRDLLVALLHQHYPPARRVHLLAPQHVGGAGR